MYKHEMCVLRMYHHGCQIKAWLLLLRYIGIMAACMGRKKETPAADVQAREVRQGPSDHRIYIDRRDGCSCCCSAARARIWKNERQPYFRYYYLRIYMYVCFGAGVGTYIHWDLCVYTFIAHIMPPFVYVIHTI